SRLYEISPRTRNRAAGNRNTLPIGGTLHQLRQIYYLRQRPADPNIGKWPSLARIEPQKVVAILRVEPSTNVGDRPRNRFCRVPFRPFGKQQSSVTKRLRCYTRVRCRQNYHPVK